MTQYIPHEESKINTQHVDELSKPAHILTESDLKHGDAALKIVGDGRVAITEADNRRIRIKTDKRILSILVWVYFLQILDKAAFGYGNIFGLSSDTHLKGNQYSLAATMNAFAQIAWLPFAPYFIVRVPARYLMSILVLGWGIAQATMAASSSFAGLCVTRFLLGLFEGACSPLFSVLTAVWYRRSEQPIRIALWYATNGPAIIFISLISYGLGRIHNDAFRGWRAIYLVCGLITVFSVPIIYRSVDSDVASARFLNEDEKAQAIERLRANQTGTGTNEFKWSQVWEMLYDTKSHMWFIMTMLLNTAAVVTNAFGPTLIANFGFDAYTTTLLNIPFGVLQLIAILLSSYLAQKSKYKSIMLTLFLLPSLGGLIMLYVEANSTHYRSNVALGGYYLLAFMFGGNPLIISWVMSNTGGQTKKSASICWNQLAGSVGNVIGPLLFTVADKNSHYKPGIKAVMGLFAALIAAVWLTVLNLYILNKIRRRQRIKNGKPEFIVDTSMNATYTAYGQGDTTGTLGINALLDMTDYQNDEFTYVY